ncbi:MAG: DUF1127 domain-containing protein [Pseudomonadota bacterium]
MTTKTQPTAAQQIPAVFSAADASTARELSGLNDHLLRDIGLSRIDVELLSGDIFRMMR